MLQELGREGHDKYLEGQALFIMYLVVETTQTPFPSVSALMHTPPSLLQSPEQTEAPDPF